MSKNIRPMDYLSDSGPGKPTKATLEQAFSPTPDEMPWGQVKNILAARNRLEQWYERAAVHALTEDRHRGDKNEYGRCWLSLDIDESTGNHISGHIVLSEHQEDERAPRVRVWRDSYSKSELRSRYGVARPTAK